VAFEAAIVPVMTRLLLGSVTHVVTGAEEVNVRLKVTGTVDDP